MMYRILYRGSLSSCNYACPYCPFAKRTNTLEELGLDKSQLNRFVDWVEQQQSNQFGVLFTPWGEGLIHPYYQQALTRLSHVPHVNRVVIQTNLSGKLDWVKQSNKASLALWTTFHPGETSLDDFLRQCSILDGAGVRYSVGVVGLNQHLGIIEEMRKRIPPHIYLWINAYKDVSDYYSEEMVNRFLNVDPLFHINNQFHRSEGLECRSGNTSFSVDGEGNVTRCHFIKERIGNLYRDSFPEFLNPQSCTKAMCGCYIGYMHLNKLKLENIYGDSLLERIPLSWP